MNQHVWMSLQANLQKEAEALAALEAVLADADSDAAQAMLDALSAMGVAAASLALECGELAAGGSAVKVAVVGDFSAGKSSFINSLLQDDGLCPGHDDPTTSCVTSFAFGAVERVERHDANGRRTKLTREKYHDQVQHRRAGVRSAEVRRFSFHLPNPLLKDVELLDTPGFNNPRNANDSDVTSAIMDEAEAFIYLVDVAGGAIAESGLARLREIRSRAKDAPIYLMLSKADGKPPAVLVKMKAELQKKHADLFSGQPLCWSDRKDIGREDIDTSAALADLFGQMHRDKQVLTAKALALRMRAHQDVRCQLEVRLRPLLAGLVAQHGKMAAWAERTEQEVSELLDQLQRDIAPDFLAEVRWGLSSSFVVTKIPKTGWLFDQAEIYLSRTPLPSAMGSFDSIAQLRKRLLTDIARHFKGFSAEVRATIEGMHRSALDETVGKAQAHLHKAAQKMLGGRHDTDTVARRHLGDVLASTSGELGESLWRDWMCWISGLYNLLREEYFEPTLQRAHGGSAHLNDILSSYRALVAEADGLTS